MRTRFALALSAVTLVAMSPVQAEWSLTILHFNDLHARYSPFNAQGLDCSPADVAKNNCFGGIAKLVEVARERRVEIEQNGGHVLLLNGGDLFQGSLFYAFYKGKAGAPLMDALNLDAMVVGNHEFDDGPSVLAEFVDAVNFSVLGANVEVTQGSRLADLLSDFVLFEKGGERVAVIGVVAEDTAKLSSPGAHVQILPIEDALPPIISAVEAEGVEKIILLSHVGLDRDRELVARIPGIDLIVGGHSHTLLANRSEDAQGPYPVFVEGPDGTSVPIVQVGSRGSHLGEIEVTFEDGGRVIRAEGEPILLDGTKGEDGHVARMVAGFAKPLQEWQEMPVGMVAGPVDGAHASCRFRECAMGNLVADAIMWKTAAFGTEIVITNAGGIRASFDAGEVTQGDVLSALPFGNTVSTFLLSGWDVQAALENGVSQAKEGAGKFPQVAGIRFAWQASAPAGERLLAVEMIGPHGAVTALDPDRMYRVASNSFLRRGGDGYDVFMTGAVDAYDYGPNMEEMLVDYLGAHFPIAPRVEGRIIER